MIKLSFDQNDPPNRKSFWPKHSLITHILFELCLNRNLALCIFFAHSLSAFLSISKTFISFLNFHFPFCTNRNVILDLFQVFFHNYYPWLLPDQHFFYNWVKWCCKKVKVVVLFWYSFRSENNLIHYWSIKFILKIENSCFFEGPAEISYAIMKTMMLKQWIRLTFWPLRTSRLSRYIEGNWCVV